MPVLGYLRFDFGVPLPAKFGKVAFHGRSFLRVFDLLDQFLRCAEVFSSRPRFCAVAYKLLSGLNVASLAYEIKRSEERGWHSRGGLSASSQQETYQICIPAFDRHHQRR